MNIFVHMLKLERIRSYVWAMRAFENVYIQAVREFENVHTNINTQPTYQGSFPLPPVIINEYKAFQYIMNYIILKKNTHRYKQRQKKHRHRHIIITYTYTIR